MEWKKCRDCPYGGVVGCALYGYCAHNNIPICPLATEYFKELSDAEQFMLKYSPNILSKYISKKIPIKIGDKVATLRPGFSGDSGKVLEITDISNNSEYWYASDGEHTFQIPIDTWYENVIKIIDPHKSVEEAVKELEIFLDIDRYANSVYVNFREDVCESCNSSNLCLKSKADIYKCPKFENYYVI